MKQKYPFDGGNQLVGGSKFQLYSGGYGSGGRCQFYRSVIAAVSGSVFCMVMGEHAAAAQTADATVQTPGQMLAETTQSSPPTLFGGLDMKPAVQWPVQPLELAESPIFSSSTVAVNSLPQSYSTNVGIAPSISADPSADSDTSATLTLPGLPAQPTVYKNEISASADFMYGTGTITVPIGFALRTIPLSNVSFPVSAVSANRSTVYYGGTISYSFGRSWYLDFSGENGRSTGSTSLSIPDLGGPPVPASFNISDTWYQVYLRYNFQNFLAGTRFRAYLRGGVTLIEATLDTVNNPFSSYGSGQFYSEHDNTFDARGNLGFGLAYSIYSTVRLKVGLQLEGEGFAGNRSQDITESIASLTGNTTINDTVYGAIGRLTLHADYRLGQSGRWKLTGDLGMMTMNSFVSYPDFGTKGEALYGPYAKAGLSFVF